MGGLFRGIVYLPYHTAGFTYILMRRLQRHQQKQYLEPYFTLPKPLLLINPINSLYPYTQTDRTVKRQASNTKRHLSYASSMRLSATSRHVFSIRLFFDILFSPVERSQL